MIPHSQPWITSKELIELDTILKTFEISPGKLNVELAEKISRNLSKRRTLLTASGSSSLYLILTLMNIGVGDEVIIPTYVCESVLHAIRLRGATPILCDIGEFWVMTYQNVRPLITKRTKAIILVHIFGINAWNEDFLSIKIPVIEDICQAFELNKGDSMPGTNTPYAFGSFHGTKCIGAGSGGFASFSSEKFIDDTINANSDWKILGTMSNLHASIALSILDKYEEILSKRLHIANQYFKKMPPHATDKLNKISNKTMYFRFPLISSMSWDVTSKSFAAENIIVRKGVDALLHRKIGVDDKNFKNSVETYDKTVSIPILAQMDNAQVNTVIDAVNTIIK